MRAGFAKVDAIAVVFSLLIISSVVWAVILVGGEKRRIWVCAHHLKQLAQAFDSYSKEHDGTLPAAFFDDGKSSNSWDTAISVYLQTKSGGQSSGNKSGEPDTSTASIFKCPSDPGPRGNSLGRSYAMPVYDINKAGWPPDQDSIGGLGLYLDAKTLKKARQSMSVESRREIPSIQASMAQDPADTALLVEHIASGNILFQPKYASIASVSEQFDTSTISAKDFHGGKMNYLLLDGHVELLWPMQSGGHVGSGDQGFWTMRSGD